MTRVTSLRTPFWDMAAGCWLATVQSPGGRALSMAARAALSRVQHLLLKHPCRQLRLAEQRCLAAETPEPAAFFSLDDSDSDSDEDARHHADRPARASSLPHPATSEPLGAHHRPTISLVDLGLQVCLPLPRLPAQSDRGPWGERCTHFHGISCLVQA